MASRSQTFSLFRQCSAARAAVARQAASSSSARVTPAASLRGFRSRPYSTEATGKEGESSEAKDDKKAESGSGGADSKDGKVAEKNGECEKKLKAKEDECVDLTSRLRYLQADFLNLQRNAAREKEQTKDFAITRFAKDLLETVDVLSMALKTVPEEALKVQAEGLSDAAIPSATSSSSSPSSTPTKSAQDHLQELHTGVEATHRMLLSTLFRYGVKPHDPTGEAFDPNKHEALYQAPIPGKTPGTVIQCQKVGYTIKDRVLRAAQVGVASESS